MSQIRIDAREFSELMNDAKAFDKKLGLAIRRRIRDAAKPIVAKQREALTTGTTRSKGFGRFRKKTIRNAVGKEQYLDKNGKVRTRTIYESKKTSVYERVKIRQLVAEGLSFRVSTGKTGGAGRFVASSSKVPPNRKALVKAFNKQTFRHRIFGGDEWVEQQGFPYFGSVVLSEADELRKAIDQALDEAAKALGRSRVRGPR